MLEALKQVSRLNTPAPIGKYTIQFKNTLVNIKTEKTKGQLLCYLLLILSHGI